MGVLTAINKTEYTSGTWEQLRDGPEFQGGPELLVTLWNVSQGRTSFLSTDPKRCGEKGLYKASLADIIAACCAGPYFSRPAPSGPMTAPRWPTVTAASRG